MRADARYVRCEEPPQAVWPGPGRRRSARDGAALRSGVVRVVPGAAGAGRAAEGGCQRREFRRSGAYGPHGRTAAWWRERTGNFLDRLTVTPASWPFRHLGWLTFRAANRVRLTPVSDSGRRPVGRSRRNFSRSTAAMTPPVGGPAVPSLPDGPAGGVFLRPAGYGLLTCRPHV